MKDEFRREGVAAASERHLKRPWSITVIGMYMLFGACLMPINVLMHAPAFLMGVDFRRGKATVFFLALGTLDAVIGIGLLRLAPWSRMLAIYFFVFRALNTLLTFLLPGSRARFEEWVVVMRASLGQQSAPRAPIWFGPVVELSVMAAVLWFLFTHKTAFVPPDNRATPPPLAAQQDI